MEDKQRTCQENKTHSPLEDKNLEARYDNSYNLSKAVVTAEFVRTVFLTHVLVLGSSFRSLSMTALIWGRACR
jgi:hypothetical protein